jgi:hypothetical protein
MGRLAHLRETLGTVANQSGTSSVVVDYSCPQHCGDWVEQSYPSVRVVRVPNQRWFCPAHARNLGAEVTDAPWLCFLDADVALAPSFAADVLPQLRPGNFYLAAPFHKELYGTVLCAKDDFVRAGGYDIVIQGYGGEDADLYARFRLLGFTEMPFPTELLRPLIHGDKLRVQHFCVKDPRVSEAITEFTTWPSTTCRS